MLPPTERPFPSWQPRFAASMLPGPPPVMMGNPSSASMRAHDAGRPVLREGRRRARGPEHRDRVVHVGERVEPFDELPHDPQHPPRIGPGERPPLAGDLREEPFVLSDRRAWRAAQAL